MKRLSRKNIYLSLAAGLSLFAVLIAGCGSEEPATSAPAATATPTSAPATEPAAAATTAPSATDAPAATMAPAHTSAPTEAPEMTLDVGHESGQKAPDFMLTTLEGDAIGLSDFQDRPLMLYFYASW